MFQDKRKMPGDDVLHRQGPVPQRGEVIAELVDGLTQQTYVAIGRDRTTLPVAIARPPMAFIISTYGRDGNNKKTIALSQ
jgi:hypothetical protein